MLIHILRLWGGGESWWSGNETCRLGNVAAEYSVLFFMSLHFGTGSGGRNWAPATCMVWAAYLDSK